MLTLGRVSSLIYTYTFSSKNPTSFINNTQLQKGMTNSYWQTPSLKPQQPLIRRLLLPDLVPAPAPTIDQPEGQV